MVKLAGKVVAALPRIAVFYAENKFDVAKTGRIWLTRLVHSDGETMVCCDDDGTPFLVSLRSVLKVSPRNTEYCFAHYDDKTGCVVACSAFSRETISFGPITGGKDPVIDLRDRCAAINLDFDSLRYRTLGPITEPFKSALTTDEIKAGPVKPTYQELEAESSIANAEHFLSVAALDPPDLSELIWGEDELVDDASRDM